MRRSQGWSARDFTAMNKEPIQRKPFGHLANGEEATLYTLRAGNDLCVSITDYGGTITSILAPDREGALEAIPKPP